MPSYPGQDYSGVLAAHPQVAAADRRIWESIRHHLPKRWSALVLASVTGLLGLECQLDQVRGDLGTTVATAWLTTRLRDPERAILRFAECVTLASSSIGQSDLASLREAGLGDRGILALAALIAYQNYRCRATQALGVRL